MRRVFLSVVVVLCASLYLAAAEYRFDSWTTDNGLPQNGIRHITQTPDGYLWFTTFDGLVRFDGLRFTVFTKGNTPGIVNNRFAQLRSDVRGTLFAQTEDEMLTVGHNGVFKTYGPSEVPGGRASAVSMDEHGEVRIITPTGTFHFRDGQFVFVAPSLQQPPGAPRKEFLSRSGTKWVVMRDRVEQIRDGQTLVYHVNTTEIIKPPAAPPDVPEVEFEDNEGGLWFGVYKTGVYRLHDGKITLFAENAGVPRNITSRFFRQEQDGSIWFSSGDSNYPGVGIFQLKDGKASRFGQELGLSNDRVMDLFRDREGTLWVATNKGLNRLRRQVITSLSTKDGLIHNEVYPIRSGRAGDILIGTAGGLSRYKDGRFVNYALHKTGIQNVQGLFEDEKGRLWAGVVGGLDVWENGVKRNYDIQGTGVTMIQDRNGSIWLGSWSGGLFKFNDDQITARYTVADGMPSNDVKVLHEDRQGALWIGTYGGLSLFKEGRFTNYTTAEGLASDRVRSIYEDSDGVLWVGTYDGGLSRFKDGKFFNFTTENGLFNNGVFATVEDDYGNLWMSCNRGIYRVNKQQLNDFADGKISSYDSYAYGKEDGMLTTECNGGRQPSSLKDKDGRIWFPTLEGVAIVDPRLVARNPLPPPVVIESVAVDREEKPQGELLSLIADPQTAIQVGSAQTSLDITYTAPSFINSSQIRFRYKLDGLNPDWVDAGTRRSVNYSYLPPGEYTFTVTAANSDGVWNSEGCSIRIAVAAPFYRTWWFPTLAAVAIVLIVLLVYRRRVDAMKRAEAAHEAFSRQLIESQESERKRIAAELHDGLGQNLLVIKNRALLGRSVADADKAKQQFDEIQDSVTEALSEVRSIAYNLRPLHLERLGLTSTLEEMVEQVEDASGIKITVDIAPVDDVLTKENEINFYRIVQECLNNVVKHSGAKTASVNVERDGTRIVLTVRDDGSGFDVTRTESTGLGLNGIAERAKILGGVHSIESAPGQGTTVRVEIEVVKA